MVVQIISAYEIFLFAGAVLVVVVGVYTVRRQIKTQMEEYATKNYVNIKMDVMDEKVKSIEKEHKDTKEDIQYIRSRIDTLIDLHLKENK